MLDLYSDFTQVTANRRRTSGAEMCDWPLGEAAAMRKWSQNALARSIIESRTLRENSLQRAWPRASTWWKNFARRSHVLRARARHPDGGRRGRILAIPSDRARIRQREGTARLPAC